MSSVLVRGMEMPYICDCCDFCDIDYNNYNKCCKRLFKDIPWEFGQNGMLPDCPLVEVKTPHGRLIDADKFVYGKTDCFYETEMDLKFADTVIEAEE